VAAIAAAATGIVALTKSSTENYAEYEQLVGGVETLFKDSSDAVVEYANNAYKTAGLSANDYMATVTSFSASLLQSLGGDTAAAADMADMAITDMSDNANKMGTDMEAIQNAYNGFAKQNYTMLDNLKLGYGGTKEEMERLIADAEKLTGLDLDISSYADIVTAIHAVQTEMGITGTTASEASTTIQGSISSMKAAWTNFLTGMADPEQNFDTLLGNLVDSVVTVADNLVPRIAALLPRLTEGITQLVSALLPQIPGIIGTLLPAVMNGAEAIIAGVVAILPELLTVIMGIVPDIVQGITELLPQLASAGFEIILALINGITESLPTLIPSIVQVLLDLIQVFTDNIPLITQAGLDLMTGLVQGILEALPTIIAALPTIITGVVDALLDNIPLIIDAGVQLLGALVDDLPTIVNAIVGALPQIIIGIVNGLIESWPEIKQAGVDMFTKIADSVSEVWGTIKEAVTGLWNDIVGVFSDAWASFVGVGESIVNGVWQGIKNVWDGLVTWFTGLWDGLVGGVKSFLGIASPSKVFAAIGGFMADGLGEGFSKEMSAVKPDIESQMNFGTAGMNVSATSAYNGRPAVSGATFGDIVINVSGAKYTTEEGLAEAISVQLQDVLRRKAAVWA
jgi:phage-related protein